MFPYCKSTVTTSDGKRQYHTRHHHEGGRHVLNPFFAVRCHNDDFLFNDFRFTDFLIDTAKLEWIWPFRKDINSVGMCGKFCTFAGNLSLTNRYLVE